MSEENKESQKIEIHPVESKQLTPYYDEFFITHINEGDDVLIGGGFGGSKYIRCDFSNFSEKLKTVTPEKLLEHFKFNNELKAELPQMDDSQREMVNACWRATRITRNVLGDLATETNRNLSFDEYKTTLSDGLTISVKPLSKCAKQSNCSEYVLLTHHVLEKMGIKSSIVVGAYSKNQEDLLAGRHTYLVLEDGNYVFDPTHSASNENSWPPIILKPETPITPEAITNMETDDPDSFGIKIVCTDIITGEKRIYGSGAT